MYRDRDVDNICVERGGGFDTALSSAGWDASAEVPKWYAVQTKSRHEKRVSTLLDALDVEHYLPLRAKLNRWSDRNKLVNLPVFSGYVFVHINLLRDSRLRVLTVPGVLSIISNRGGPAPIPNKEIEDIRTVLASNAEYSLCAFPEVGDRVRVFRGVFAGVEGTLVGGSTSSQLLVSIEAVRQSLSLRVSPEDVERASPHSQAAEFSRMAIAQ